MISKGLPYPDLLFLLPLFCLSKLTTGQGAASWSMPRNSSVHLSSLCKLNTVKISPLRQCLSECCHELIDSIAVFFFFSSSFFNSRFRMNGYASFHRQCLLHGFRRIPSGPDRGGYYHELFLRGQRHLTHQIVRQERRQTGEATVDPPDFYRLPFMISRTPRGEEMLVLTCVEEDVTRDDRITMRSALRMDPLRFMSSLDRNGGHHDHRRSISQVAARDSLLHMDAEERRRRSPKPSSWESQ